MLPQKLDYTHTPSTKAIFTIKLRKTRYISKNPHESQRTFQAKQKLERKRKKATTKF